MSALKKLLLNRYSVRQFLNKPVEKSVLRELLSDAALSPSGTNIQPWKLHILSSNKIEQLEERVLAEIKHSPQGQQTDIGVYPKNMPADYNQRRKECGLTLYEGIGLSRDDTLGRNKQMAKNANFFGASTGIVFTVDKAATEMQILDCGIYIQSLMLLAHEKGLGTCAQGFWTLWPTIIKQLLSKENPSINNDIVITGLAIGYPDDNAKVNSVRQKRLPVDEFCFFYE